MDLQEISSNFKNKFWTFLQNFLCPRKNLSLRRKKIRFYFKFFKKNYMVICFIENGTIFGKKFWTFFVTCDNLKIDGQLHVFKNWNSCDSVTVPKKMANYTYSTCHKMSRYNPPYWLVSTVDGNSVVFDRLYGSCCQVCSGWLVVVKFKKIFQEHEWVHQNQVNKCCIGSS